MAWLSGWDNRIKLTIDNTKVDSELSHFPVTVVLSSTHGDCVFDELTSNANRTKIAFTKSDGTTQLYGEIEKWDDANESAVIHVSLSGWSISSSADTDFYMYYDSSHAANTTYIGDIDSTPGHSVWDSNFKFVCHMVDATTSTVKDSTSNGNDGTKKAANEPIEAAGKIGQGQDFDGTDDKIDIGTIAEMTSWTLEAACNPDRVAVTTSLNGLALISNDVGGWNDDILFGICVEGTGHNTTKRFGVTSQDSVSEVRTIAEDDTDAVIGTDYHVVARSDGSDLCLLVDGALKDTTAKAGTALKFGGTTTYLGATPNALRPWYGIISETRISETNRSAAWVKATYNTLWDTLLTYGSEETDSGGVTENAVFFGMAF